VETRFSLRCEYDESGVHFLPKEEIGDFHIRVRSWVAFVVCAG